MTYEIKKGIPVAPKRAGNGGHGQQPIYPFAQMEVGDCFDAPRDLDRTKQGRSDRRQGIIVNCARGYAKKYNPTAKFTTRLIDENTVRCWRVA